MPTHRKGPLADAIRRLAEREGINLDEMTDAEIARALNVGVSELRKKRRKKNRRAATRKKRPGVRLKHRRLKRFGARASVLSAGAKMPHAAVTIKAPGLTSNDRLQLAARALVDQRTIGAAYHGRPVRPMTLARIEQAAREMGLPLPPTKRGKR